MHPVTWLYLGPCDLGGLAVVWLAVALTLALDHACLAVASLAGGGLEPSKLGRFRTAL